MDALVRRLQVNRLNCPGITSDLKYIPKSACGTNITDIKNHQKYTKPIGYKTMPQTVKGTDIETALKYCNHIIQTDHRDDNC